MAFRKIIQCPRGAVARLCSDFGCAKTTVYDALNGTTTSEKAALIRQKAISYGGVITKKMKFT